MKVFEANFGDIVIRYYLLMGVVMAAFFTGIYWLAIFAIPIFISALMGVKFFGNNRLEDKVAHEMHQDSSVSKAA